MQLFLLEAGRINLFLYLWVSSLSSRSWCQLDENEANVLEPWEWHVKPADLATFQGSQLDLLFLVASVVSSFPAQELTMQNDPGSGISLPTPVGKVPWARFEAEVAQNSQCPALKMYAI